MMAARNQKGFSLIELLVVIALMGIMAGMASLGFDFVRRERIASNTKELLADIQKVRMDALTIGPSSAMPNLRGFGIRFDSAANTYVVFAFDDNNGDFIYSGTPDEENAQTHSVSSSTTLQISKEPSFNILTYDRFGVPTRYKSDGMTTATNLVILVKDTSNGYAKCVSVNTNSIREGAWNAGTSTCVEQ